VKKEEHRNQKPSPLGLDTRVYTAGIRSSNLLEPTFFSQLDASIMVDDEHQQDDRLHNKLHKSANESSEESEGESADYLITQT
jgi:hypothetical protein